MIKFLFLFSAQVGATSASGCASPEPAAFHPNPPLLSGCDLAEVTWHGMVTVSPNHSTVDTFNQVVTSGGLMPHFHIILFIALKMETLASKHS